MIKLLPHWIAALAAVTLIMSAAISPGAHAETTLRLNTVGNEEGIAYLGSKRFADIVEERTDGEIKVRIHHSSALGDQESSLQSLQSGTLDLATIETPITSVDAVLGATALPYLFRDREHVAAALEGEAGEWITQRLADKGLRVISFMEGGFRQITNNVRPIVTPADLEGIKMRTPESNLRIKIFNSWGANASPLPFSELYSALQTGVFDGQENPVIWAKSTKFYEVQDYLSLTNHLYTITYLLMGEEKFQSLSPEQQEILLAAGREAAAHTASLASRRTRKSPAS